MLIHSSNAAILIVLIHSSKAAILLVLIYCLLLLLLLFVQGFVFDPGFVMQYEGVSICNENPFITPSTNALGSYAI